MVRAGLALREHIWIHVTDPAVAGQPRAIFIATLWAEGSWLFFLRRGGSTRMTQILALYRQSGSDRLEKLWTVDASNCES
jgi:hypothetical protein